MSSEKDLLFEYEGFKVYKNNVYIVGNKVDFDLPSGWVNAGMSKMSGVGDSAQCPFITSANVYDHGFDLYCPRYKYEDKTIAEEKVRNLKVNVVEPFLRATGKNIEDLGMHNFEFWDKFIAKIKESTSYRTDDPTEVMNLYISLLSGRLCPRGEEGNPKFSGSSYIVFGVNESKKSTDNRISNKFKATGVFANLIESNPTKARAILFYMGIPIDVNNDLDGVAIVFNSHIAEKPEKVDEFLTLENKFNTEQGEAEMLLFQELTKKINKKDSPLQKVKGIIYYGDDELGVDLKEVASKLANPKAKNLQQIADEIVMSLK